MRKLLLSSVAAISLLACSPQYPITPHPSTKVQPTTAPSTKPDGVDVSKLTWDERAIRANRLASEFFERANQLGFNPYSLSVVDKTIDTVQHECAILAEMNGFDRAKDKLRIHYPPAAHVVSGKKAAERGFSLWNFSTAVDKLLTAPRALNEAIWNLNCVPEFRLDRSQHIPMKEGVSFFVQGKKLMVVGDITMDFAELLKAWLDTNPQINTVALASGGGIVMAAIVAGAVIRTRNLNTEILTNCYSACTIVFVGGVKRTMSMPVNLLFYHQVSRGSNSIVPQSDKIVQGLGHYLRAAGVNDRTIMRWMYTAQRGGWTIPDYDELCTSGVINYVARLGQPRCIVSAPRADPDFLQFLAEIVRPTD